MSKGEAAMVMAIYSMKGGVGVSTFAAICAICEADERGALLVDLCGDQAAVLGLGPAKPQGVTDWVEAAATAPDDALGRIEVPARDGLGVLLRGRTMPAADRAETLVDRLAADDRSVVIDCGSLRAPGPLDSALEAPPDLAFRTAVAAAATTRVLVARSCYLALRASAKTPVAPTSVALVSEPGRSLGVDDAAAVLDVPVDFDIAADPVIARLVDSGMLMSRLPRSLRKALARGLFRTR